MVSKDVDLVDYLKSHVLICRGIAKVKDGHAKSISGLRNMISCILTRVVSIFKLVKMPVLLYLIMMINWNIK